MTAKDNLVLTAVGPDQVGLVEKISEFITRRDCNIEDSKMAVFCGEFALILLVSGDQKNLEKIARQRDELESHTGLNIQVKMPAARKTVESSLIYNLKASCMDHPGVVYGISGILRRFGINMESMETETYPAPVSGAAMFRLEGQISVPAQADIQAVRRGLQVFADDENVDIELSRETDKTPT